MARPRKNAAKAQSSLLTVDGVQEDVIPVEEQPYPLPEGWKWVTLGDVVSVSKEKTEDFSSPSLRYIGLEHLEKDYGIIGFASVEGIRSLKNIFHPGQILYGKLRPYLNKHDIVDFPGVCSTDILVFSCKDGANNKFINYFFNLNHFKEYAVANSKGINLPRISEQVVLNAFFPLPPFDDQQRIVDRIESLFAKLDEAKEKAEAVLDGFESRKAAILHRAFTGELISKKNVRLTKLEDLLDTIRIGPFGSALHEEDYITGGIPVINPKHIVRQKIFPQWKVTISPQKAKELIAYRLLENDIILGRRGEMGRCAPITDQEAGWLCGTGSMILRLKPMFQAKFYSMIIASQASVQYLEINAVGTTLKNLNEKIIRKLPIPEFSVDEQKILIRILDSLLAKEQQVKEAAESVLEHIDLMKKAILARAFRGELKGQVDD